MGLTMPITLEKIEESQWIRERITQQFKNKNIKYIKDLNFIIEKCSKNINAGGLIVYKNGDSKENITTNHMFYNYGSPAPWLCKLLPNGYGFNYFEPNDIYRKCHVESDIQSKLLKLYDSGLFTRYSQPKSSSNINLPDEYILVTMQNTGGTVWYRKDFSILANDIIRWSRENKKHVIFKWHNGCIDHANPERWFEELQEKSDYSNIEYKLPLSTLIKKCKIMWTASSMSGIEALINNKPVSIFGETEYMEMASVCNTPEEAINAKIPDDLERWLTYYVRKYCINIYAKDAEYRVTNRLINYFEKNLPLDELILS
jgi:hypothetical protein